jgi:hypothetical protein
MNMRMRPLMVIGAALAALALLAGCGGSGSSSGGIALTGGETAVAGNPDAGKGPAAWAGIANANCAENSMSNESQEKQLATILEHGLANAANRAEAAEFIEDGTLYIKVEAEAINQDPPPPAADQAKAAQLRKRIEAMARVEEKLAHALKGGSVHEVETRIGAVRQSQAGLRRLTKELGMKACGRPGAFG